MATHSNIPAWEILWTEEPGRLQSMGLQRVKHYFTTKKQQQQILSSTHKGASTFSLKLRCTHDDTDNPQ